MIQPLIVKRPARAKRKISLEELKALKKRYRDGTVSQETIATLEELLLAGKDRILFKPDLKPGVLEHFDALARLIVRLEMQDQVFIRTFYRDAETIHDFFKTGTPRVEMMFKLSNAKQVDQIHREFQPKTVDIKVSGELPLSAGEKGAIEAARNLGILVEAHSFENPEFWEVLAQAGVRCFIRASLRELSVTSKRTVGAGNRRMPHGVTER